MIYGFVANFTRLAARLGVAQLTLSQTIRALEERLRVRADPHDAECIADRSRRALAAGSGPRLDETKAELESLRELRDKPAGTFRVSAIDFTVDYILWPKLAPFMEKYPDIKFEIVIDYAMTDIAAAGYDSRVVYVEWSDVICVRSRQERL